MAATNTTTNFSLNLTDFDKIPWGEEQHNNWHIVDALMARFIAVSLIKGAWENALAVIVGDRYIDTNEDTIYEVLVAHTTPSTGTFAAARTANSSQWQSVTVEVANKGAYAQNTTYNANDFVVDGGRFGIVVAQYTSDNAQATTALSYNADVTSGDILTLLDASALIAATHDTNTVATGGTPTATYTAATSKFNFGLVTGATGATGATGPGSGTVTQVNAGDGFSFSAITTTGTIAVDGVLQDLDALGAPGSDGQFIVATGSGAFNYESGATAFTSIKQDASTSATGVSELATTAETITGTDTARVITPAGLHGALAGLTDTTITAADTVVFADATDSNALKEDTVQGILDLAGGGRQTFISDSGAFSGVAAVDIALAGSYDTYVLEGYGLWVASQGYEFSSLQVSDDDASSFETANYHYASVYFDASTGFDRTHSGSGINVVFSGGMDDAIDQQSFFRWEIWRPKDTSSPTYFMGRTFMHNASANIGQSLTIGSYEVEGTAITHIRVFSHDGQNGSGDNIRLWGLSGS
jgi:hypothetical protein